MTFDTDPLQILGYYFLAINAQSFLNLLTSIGDFQKKSLIKSALNLVLGIFGAFVK
jgi:hypothetical protein